MRTQNIITSTKGGIPTFKSTITFFMIFILNYCFSVTFTPVVTTINALTNYTWTISGISGLSNASNLTVMVQFPTTVVLNQSITKVQRVDGTQFTIMGFSGTNITFNISAAEQTNTTLTFIVTNVKNPPSAAIQSGFFYRSGSNSSSFISYTRGPINNCFLNFEGVTDQLVSNAIIDFQTSNPISKNITVFSITYGIYTSSTRSIAEYTNNLSCAYSINGGTTYSSEVFATFSSSASIFKCEFPGFILSANASVKLRLKNVRNPPFKKNYMNSNFLVESTDGSKSYDVTNSSCSFGDVSVQTYEAFYTESSKVINSNYNRPIVQTVQPISKNFAQNDYMQIVFDRITFLTIGNYTLFTRSTSGTNVLFNYKTGNGTTSVVSQNEGTGNSQNDKVKITLQNFLMKVPPSTTPTNLTFKFYKFSTALNLSLQYLNIFATLKPISVSFNNISSLTIVPASDKIGQRTSYTFKLNITQPLGTASRVIFLLPIESDVSLVSNISTCTFQSTDLNTVPSCSIYSLQNRAIQVNISSPNGIKAPQQLTFVIGDIINPSAPLSFSFSANTYYDQTDILSSVETGSSLRTYKYVFRQMLITTDNTLYTVNQYPATLKLIYTPYVKLPANLLMQFSFTTNLTNIAYKGIVINNSSKSFAVSQTSTAPMLFNLTLSEEVVANSTVVITFQFRAPSTMNFYNALLVAVGNNSALANLYERTSSHLQINVAKAALQTFTLTPTSFTTGVVNNYGLSFYTNVIHPSPSFFLSIQFPPQVTFFSNISCSNSSVCTKLTDNSTNSYKLIILTITFSSTSNIYNLTINNIKNPVQVGSAGPFIISTLNSANSKIIQGNSTITITTPNVAVGRFDKSKFYYRMNLQPVKIFLDSFYNEFKKGDYLIVWFDYRTYSMATNSQIKCSTGATCSRDVTQSTNYTLAVTVVPSNQTLPIIFSIQGLNSSSTTFPNQIFQVVIRTYSGNGRQKDEVKLPYNLSCSSSQALINKNCQTCTQISCLSCYTGYYLLNGQCVTNCPSASQYQAYANNQSSCTACKAPCKTCISELECLTCVDTFFLNTSSYCISTCSAPGYYVDTINGIKMCIQCWSLGCIKCLNGSSVGCIDCGTGFLQNGKCISDCGGSTTYISNNQCLPCNIACSGCTGPSNAECIACRGGYFNISGKCQQGCPAGQVALNSTTCGCSSLCGTCQVLPTRCVTCSNTSHVLYNGQCLQTCPNSSYHDVGLNRCIDCAQGCQTCSATACLQCLTGYNVYQMKCYTQCNNIGPRFAAINGKCVQCPQGCDLCDENLTCSVCLTNFTLVNQSRCEKTCILQNNCEKVSPVPDKIIPIPGFITAAVWLIIIVVLKFIFINKMYLPYSYIFVSCIVEYILIIAVLAKMDVTIKTLLAATSSRLLQTISSNQVTPPQLYQYAVLGILAASLALNYIQNFVFLFLFCKYLKKYIPDRQIDKISNYLILILGVLTNFRLSLMAYSKMFPKPNITVQNQSKLTPLHYMCISSIFTSILPLAAAGIQVYNQYPLTDLFMLGVDLLLIVIISLIFTVWMVSVDKPSEYFQSTKKYSKQEFNQTTQAFNEKDDAKNDSKHRLSYNSNVVENSVIQVQDIKQQILSPRKYNASNYNNNKDYRDDRPDTKFSKNNKSDYQNQPLPQIPIRNTQVNLQTMKIKAKQSNNMNQSAIQIEQPNAIQDGDGDGDDLSLEEYEQQSKNKLKGSISINDKKTQRISNRSDIKKSKLKNNSNNNNSSKKRNKANTEQKQDQHDPRFVINQTKHEGQRGIINRSKQSPKNFGKQRNAKKKQKNADLNLKLNQTNRDSNQVVQNEQSQQIQDSLQARQPSIKPVQSDIIQRQKKVIKPATQRSSGIIPVTMKKKQSYGLFESEKAQSQVDQIDLQSIIQTKMIDKSKQKPNMKKGGASNKKQDMQEHEQISPSWFNQQNQRFDFQENNSDA